VREDEYIQKESGMGLAWAKSGGQAEAFGASRTLSVSGFDEVVTILEMLEAGRLSDLSFIEAHICRGGCLGGPLTVENPYRAGSVIRPHIQRCGAYARVDRDAIRRLMKEGMFHWEPEFPLDKAPALAPEPAQAIDRLKRIQELTARLPGSECGLCGAPNCRTFAQDVIQGLARRDDCPFLETAGIETPRSIKKESMTVKELVEALDLEVAAGAGGLDRRVSGGYISDLLSDVMANAGEGCLWLTVQVHQNLVAVAVLRDIAAICLVGGRRPQEDTVAKADQENIPILLSAEDAYGLAGRLHGLGLGRGA
jgi:hypothetical protein